ncbi:MAG: PQQ-binding-like beta-propeller repeat protein [bacterium]
MRNFFHATIAHPNSSPIRIGLLLLLLPAGQLPGANPGLAKTVWAGLRGGAGNSGCVDGSALPDATRFAWRWPADLTPAHADFSCAPAACLQGTLYVPVSTGRQIGLAALTTGDPSPDSASSTKPPDTNKWFVATAQPPGQTVAATTTCVYFTEGRVGDAGRQLHCVDAASGRRLWQVPISASASGEFLLTTSGLYIFCRDNELSHILVTGERAGQLRWSTPVGVTVGAPCATADAIFASTRKGVVALRKATGAVIWRQPSHQLPITGPVASEDLVVVGMANGISGLSMVNGGTLWTVKCTPAPVPLAVDAARVLGTTAQGEIVVAGWDGRELYRQPGAMTNQPPMLFGDKVLFCGPDAMQLIDLSKTNAESRWLATAWLGAITAPPILSDGIVYFATAEKGMICARQGKR